MCSVFNAPIFRLPYLILFLVGISASSINGQTKAEEFVGAWKSIEKDSAGNEVTVVAIVTAQYHSNTWYSEARKEFVRTTGGSWKLKGDELQISYEFDTKYPDNVGSTKKARFQLDGDELVLLPENIKWQRVDDGTPGQLANAWLITGRKRDNGMQTITPGARKTMKILSGTRFQWIAYNSESGQFFGTGGGTYTSENGKYVENIDFFSRDSNRVGASLEFDFELVDGEWHHSGLSSKGSPIYEIWSPRETLDR